MTLLIKNNIADFAIPKLQAAVGGKLVVSTSEGNIEESSDSNPIPSVYI